MEGSARRALVQRLFDPRSQRRTSSPWTVQQLEFLLCQLADRDVLGLAWRMRIDLLVREKPVGVELDFSHQEFGTRGEVGALGGCYQLAPVR